jgi:RNA polymerase sigma-70 factor (ECF subfamily)
MVDEHLDFIWRLLRRKGLSPEDADDATQRVFMIASEKIGEIEPGREKNFLYGSALRVAANARRVAGRRREEAAESLDDRVADAKLPDDDAELRRTWGLVHELLARMPEELARVLALAGIEQVEVSEIAELEGIPAGTAASRLRRARAAFRELVTELGDRNPFAQRDR